MTMIRDLRHVVISLAQEIRVLQDMLVDAGAWDDTRYKELLRRRLIHDHDSTGMTSWRGYSHYRHTLDEPDRIRLHGASEEEVERFARDVEEASTRT